MPRKRYPLPPPAWTDARKPLLPIRPLGDATRRWCGGCYIEPVTRGDTLCAGCATIRKAEEAASVVYDRARGGEIPANLRKYLED